MPKPPFPDNTQKPDSATLPGEHAVRHSCVDHSTNGLTRKPGDLCRGQGPSVARCAEPLMPAESPQTLSEGMRAEGDATLPSGERPHLRSEHGSRTRTGGLPLGLSIPTQVTRLIDEWHNRARLRCDQWHRPGTTLAPI